MLVAFRRRDGNSGSLSKKGYVKGNVKGKLGKADNPPDLWIHHDQMEMKGMDKSQRCNSANTVSPMARRSQDLDSLDGMPSGSTTGPRNPANPDDSLDRRGGYVTAYAGILEHFLFESVTFACSQCMALCLFHVVSCLTVALCLTSPPPLCRVFVAFHPFQAVPPRPPIPCGALLNPRAS